MKFRCAGKIGLFDGELAVCERSERKQALCSSFLARPDIESGIGRGSDQHDLFAERLKPINRLIGGLRNILLVGVFVLVVASDQTEVLTIKLNADARITVSIHGDCSM